ncbi:MAG: hypothetical protein RLY93_08960 [Sumerlaeia bacterium]
MLLLAGALALTWPAPAQQVVGEATNDPEADTVRALSGTWNASGSKSRASGLSPFGEALALDGTEGSYQWTLPLSAAGDYALQMTWPIEANAANLTVAVAGGGVDETLDTTLAPSAADVWQPLGSFSFSEGGDIVVTLSTTAATGPADESLPMMVMADSVRLVPGSGAPAAASPFEGSGASESPFAGSAPTNDSPFEVTGGPAESPFQANAPASGGASPFESVDRSPPANPSPFESGQPAAASPFDSAGSPGRPGSIFEEPETFAEPAGANESPFTASPFDSAPPASGSPFGGSEEEQFDIDPFAAAGTPETDPFADRSSNPFAEEGSGNFFEANESPAIDPFAEERAAVADISAMGEEEVDAPSEPPHGFTPTVQASRLLDGGAASNFLGRDNAPARAVNLYEDSMADSGVSVAPPAPKSNIFFYSDLEDVKKQAREQDRPVLLLFSTTGPRMEKFETGVLTDEEVSKTIRQFMPAKLDIRVESEIARQYNVPRAPYIVILSHQGFTLGHVARLDHPALLTRDLKEFLN